MTLHNVNMHIQGTCTINTKHHKCPPQTTFLVPIPPYSLPLLIPETHIEVHKLISIFTLFSSIDNIPPISRHSSNTFLTSSLQPT